MFVRNDYTVNPANFKWKWGEDELPIVHQYTHFGVEIAKDCSWDTHIAQGTRTSKSQASKMDATLTDPHLDTRIKRCILTKNMIAPKFEYMQEKYRNGTQSSKTTGNSADR